MSGPSLQSGAAPIQVLHVDDDPDFADTVAMFVEREDSRFTIEYASNAEAGRERLQAGEFDCIVSDYDMPGQNGIGFLESVRSDHPSLPFILYTGKGSEEVASEAISAGVTDYLQKEMGTSQYAVLVNRIRNAVEQARSREAVEQSEKRLRKIVDTIPELLGVIDDEGRYLLVNEALAEFHDQSIAELEGTMVDEVLDDPLVDRLMKDIGDVIAANELIRAPDVEIHDATGTPHILEPRFLPFSFPETTNQAVLLVSIDVTERNERLKELERYRAITQAATNTIITIDEANTIQSVNPAVEQTFGYTPAELIGQDLTVLMPDAVTDQHRRAFERYLETGEQTLDWTASEFQGQHRDGTTIPLSISFGEVEFDDERFFVGIIRDISDRKQMEANLRSERDLVEGIVETSPVGITVVGADGEITFVNNHAQQIYGRTGEEVGEFTHDDPRWDLVDATGAPFDDGETPFERVVAEEMPIYDQMVGLRRPSGKRVWVSVNGAPQLTDDGGLERAIFAFKDITEQRELETELREILGRITDAFYALDAEFRFTHVNERAEELLQASEEELLGKKLWDEFPEAAETDEVWEAYQTAMETQKPQSLELYYDPLDFWVEATAYPSESGLSVYFRDVTEQKEHAVERERQANRFEAFSMAFPDLTFIVSADGRILDVMAGQQSDELLFADPSSSINQPLHEVFPDETADEFVRTIQTAIETDQSAQQEYSLTVPAGERWFEARVEPLPFEVEGTEACVWVARDITARRERETELKRQQSLLEAQQAAILDGILVVDEHGEIISYNDQFIDLWGVPEKVVEERDDATVLDYVTDQLANPEEFHQQVEYLYDHRAETSRDEIRLTDGRVFDRHTTPIIGTDGRYFGRLWTFRDITERIERQIELQRQNERLEDFTSIVSHDLRNPLNVAQGQLALAQDACDSEHLDAVVQAHDRIEALIDDLLSLAREGKAVERIEEVSLQEIADRSWQNVSTQEATLANEAQSRIRADESRFQQLLENLFRNAIDHGGDNVRVNIGDMTGGFFVGDDGPGIPAAERDRVFDSGYSTQHTGTGFGLSIVHQIVVAHGWEIQVTEGPEGGARFEITGVDLVSP